MRFKTLLATVLTAALLSSLFMLLGCSGGAQNGREPGLDVNEPEFLDTSSFAGTWKASYVDASDPDAVLTELDLTELDALGIHVMITFEEDGSFVFDRMGELRAGEWNSESSTKSLLTYDGERYEANLANNTLVMTWGDETLTFVKTDNEVDQTGKVDSSTAKRAKFVVADDGFCSITAVKVAYDGAGNPGFVMKIKNRHSSDIYVNAEYGTFNCSAGPINPVLGETVEVQSSVETFMYIDASSVPAGIESLKNTTGSVVVVDQETLEVLGTYAFVYEG